MNYDNIINHETTLSSIGKRDSAFSDTAPSPLLKREAIRVQKIKPNIPIVPISPPRQKQIKIVPFTPINPQAVEIRPNTQPTNMVVKENSLPNTSPGLLRRVISCFESVPLFSFKNWGRCLTTRHLSTIKVATEEFYLPEKEKRTPESSPNSTPTFKTEINSDTSKIEQPLQTPPTTPEREDDTFLFAAKEKPRPDLREEIESNIDKCKTKYREVSEIEKKRKDLETTHLGVIHYGFKKSKYQVELSRATLAKTSALYELIESIDTTARSLERGKISRGKEELQAQLTQLKQLLLLDDGSKSQDELSKISELYKKISISPKKEDLKERKANLKKWLELCNEQKIDPPENLSAKWERFKQNTQALLESHITDEKKRIARSHLKKGIRTPKK